VSSGLAESFWIPRENALQWGFLLAGFVSFALWETFRPRRVLVASTARRWANHAILNLLCSVLVMLIYRGSAVVVASAVAGSSHGLLNREVLPFWLRCGISVLLLDLVRYGQHYLYHAVPVLWRIHQVHHGDPDYDWSTGLRFHPVEVLLTQGIYLGLIALIAPPAVAVLGLELADILENLFVHANIGIPARIDVLLRRFVITPDMHRIHHSELIAEQNTNYGVVFPWWDRMFGTYLKQPAAGHEKMGIGLRESAGKQGVGLIQILAQPFQS
jgi:sterol desaturase/sphingolipid hydroxylase (fatty acid hydroxylase superfamily)